MKGFKFVYIIEDLINFNVEVERNLNEEETNNLFNYLNEEGLSYKYFNSKINKFMIYKNDYKEIEDSIIYKLSVITKQYSIGRSILRSITYYDYKGLSGFSGYNINLEESERLETLYTKYSLKWYGYMGVGTNGKWEGVEGEDYNKKGGDI